MSQSKPWKCVPLGEIAPAAGNPLPGRNESVWNLSLEDIEANTGRVTSKVYCRVGSLGSTKCSFDQRHVLYSKLRPYLNKVVTPDTPGVGTSELIPLLPDATRIERDFLAYYLRSPRFVEFAKMHTRGANLPRISMSEIWKHDIPVPSSREEQCRIVGRIKECMERVEEIQNLRSETTKERNALLESLIEAEFQSAAGDAVVFEEVCGITSELADPRKPGFIDSIHVGGANIESETGRLIDLKTSREEKLKSAKFPFDPSMVLYNKIRPYLKKVARPDFRGICSADMYPLSPEPAVLDKDYLFFLLLSRDFTRYAIDGSNRAGMPKVNRKHLFAYRFNLPPLDQQQQIAERLNEALTTLGIMRAEYLAMQTDESHLRGAILRKAFAGEL